MTRNVTQKKLSNINRLTAFYTRCYMNGHEILQDGHKEIQPISIKNLLCLDHGRGIET